MVDLAFNVLGLHALRLAYFFNLLLGSAGFADLLDVGLQGIPGELVGLPPDHYVIVLLFFYMSLLEVRRLGSEYEPFAVFGPHGLPRE